MPNIASKRDLSQSTAPPDDPNNKRRRTTGRTKDIPNYRIARPKAKTLPHTRSHSNSLDIVEINERGVKITENSKLPSYYSQSTKNEFHLKNADNAQTIKENLRDLIIHNESALSELYHLQHFTSLVTFDPEITHNLKKDSEGFRTFHDKNNLWPEPNIGRRSRRLTEHTDPMRLEIDQMVEDKISEIEKDEVVEVKRPRGRPPKSSYSTPATPKASKQQNLIEKKQQPKTPKSPPVSRKTLPKQHTSPQEPLKQHHFPHQSPSKTVSKPQQTPEKRKRGRPRKIKPEETPMPPKPEQDLNSNSDNNDIDNNSDSSIPHLASNSHIPKRIKLNLHVPSQMITHPSHVTTPAYNGSLDELLNSYKSTLEEQFDKLYVPTSEFPNYLDSEYQLINKIKQGLDSKLLRLDFKENIFRNVPQGVKEPTIIKKNGDYHLSHFKPPIEPFRLRNELTHFDHLLAQGLKSSKLIHDVRKYKIQSARKIAMAVDIHFKRLSQENERVKKEFEKHRIRRAKDVGREIKKKWLVAVKAYRILEEHEKEKERAIKSREQLSKILDHSTKVLGAQLANRGNSRGRSDTPEIGTDIAMTTADDDDEEEEQENSDEFMSTTSSSSGSEDENDTEAPNDDLNDDVRDEDKLTAEELREKYKDLDTVKLTNEDSDSDDEVQGSGLAALYGSGLTNGVSNGTSKDKKSVVDRLTEEERLNLLEKETNPLFDEDSDSGDEADSDSMSDSDDESSSEEEISDDDDDNSGESVDGVETNGNEPGLAALFGKPVENSDDESIYSENDDDQETPTSSPKEELKDAENEDDNYNIPDVPVPSLLKGNLRIYQKEGLNWLASLYNNGTNGILADEMGLGKTIQTISLISYLACEKNIWGPHLIVVPTSVMLNWEMEFKRFAPGFKVLTYYGSPQQRKEKRQGWSKPDSFHVCVTSYQLVVQDHVMFRRKKWKYMILDEAHNIKNFRSQRWQALLNFNTENRLLLTGTPLQNNIMELWSLLYFLMPSSKTDHMMPEGFANLMDFQQWFGRPVDKIIHGGVGADGYDDETRQTVNKLHQVLRPYLLRRLKQDVEKQMPAKYEHIIHCRLSKRQRLLYDDFMSRAQTKETLASGNFLSIINCLMQLRKVCNHPDLFEVRPILTSFAMDKNACSDFQLKELVVRKYLKSSASTEDNLDLNFLNLTPIDNSNLSSYHIESLKNFSASNIFNKTIRELSDSLSQKQVEPNFNNLEKYYEWLTYNEQVELMNLFKQRLYTNDFNCNKQQLISSNLIKLLTLPNKRINSEQLEELELIKPISTRYNNNKELIDKYAFVTPKVKTNDMNDLMFLPEFQNELVHKSQKDDNLLQPFHQVQVKTSISFPDKSLLQYDCGKLQRLQILLQELIPKGHRALIFTQMTKVLDILEKFMNYNGYKYMRLDGATKIEDRQLLTERFNKDDRIKCFILSTRSGGLGINLTGADTVIFYDSDWNPAMDKQCQDRCHRIGQTRDVHIYRFVSEYTIESNILKKANQKRQLDSVVIQDGDFTTDYFSKITVKDLLGDGTGGESATGEGDNENESDESNGKLLFGNSGDDLNKALEQAEDIEDANAAKAAMKEVNLDTEDFDDDGNPNSRGRSETPQNADEDQMVRKMVEQRSNAQKRAVSGTDGSEKPRGENNEEEDVNLVDGDDNEEEDDGIGHVDEYMIRFIAGGFYFD